MTPSYLNATDRVQLFVPFLTTIQFRTFQKLHLLCPFICASCRRLAIWWFQRCQRPMQRMAGLRCKANPYRSGRMVFASRKSQPRSKLVGLAQSINSVAFLPHLGSSCSGTLARSQSRALVQKLIRILMSWNSSASVTYESMRLQICYMAVTIPLTSCGKWLEVGLHHLVFFGTRNKMFGPSLFIESVSMYVQISLGCKVCRKPFLWALFSIQIVHVD